MSTQTEAARRLTHRHRGQQLLVRKATVAQVQKLWPMLDPEDLDASYQQFAGSVSMLVEKNRQTSAGLTTQYLRTFRDMNGIPGAAKVVLPQSLNVEQFSASLRTTSVVAAKIATGNGDPVDVAMDKALTQTQGAMARLALGGGRETMLGTIQADSAATGFSRVLGGGGCDFCRMLAGRGAVYKEDTVDFEAHDHCGCTAQPEYDTSGPRLQRVDVPAALQRLQERNAAPAVVVPEAEFVERIAGLLRDGKVTAEQVRAELPKVSPLGRANAEAALAKYEAELAAKAAKSAAKVPDRFIPKPPDGSVAARVDFPQETLDALVPSRAGWTTSTRAKVLLELKKTPEGRQLLKTMDSFQSGGSTAIPRLRTDIEKYLTGNVGEMSQGRIDTIENFLSAVGRSDAGDRPLFRGMTIPGDIEDVAARYKVGEDLDMSLASFSSDKKLADLFTIKGAGKKVRAAKKTPVLVEWVGSSKRALPIERLSKNRVLSEEKEWVGAGRYAIEGVKRVKKKDGREVLVLTVRQKGTW